MRILKRLRQVTEQIHADSENRLNKANQAVEQAKTARAHAQPIAERSRQLVAGNSIAAAIISSLQAPDNSS